MTVISGTSASETLNSSNWNYSWNVFYMGDGNDTVYTPITGVAYEFRGMNGNDRFDGDSAADRAYGGNDSDTLTGWGGGDTLDGEAGNDFLYGKSGNDNLSGGIGSDYLNGGTGRDDLFGGYQDHTKDTFRFTMGDSQAQNGQADTIYDWEPAYDYIDSTISGTSSNYSERATTATSIDAARSIVEHSSSLSAKDHVFLYNAGTDTGYLLSDLNGNYTFETGVIIRGAGSSSDFHYGDII